MDPLQLKSSQNSNKFFSFFPLCFFFLWFSQQSGIPPEQRLQATAPSAWKTACLGPCPFLPILRVSQPRSCSIVQNEHINASKKALNTVTFVFKNPPYNPQVQFRTIRTIWQTDDGQNMLKGQESGNWWALPAESSRIVFLNVMDFMIVFMCCTCAVQCPQETFLGEETNKMT